MHTRQSIHIPHHLLARMPGQQPDQAAQLAIQQRGEVEERGPDQQRQNHGDKGIGDRLLPGGQRVDAVRDFVAVVFQADAVDGAVHNVAVALRGLVVGG